MKNIEQFAQTDKDFLAKRHHLNKVWGSVVPLLFAGLAILYGFLWFTAPMLVNPFAVMNRLQEDSVNITTLQTMAVMLPVVVTLLCVVTAALIDATRRSSKLEHNYRLILSRPGTDNTSS